MSTVTSNQVNASLLNESIHFFKKTKCYCPLNFWMVMYVEMKQTLMQTFSFSFLNPNIILVCMLSVM